MLCLLLVWIYRKKNCCSAGNEHCEQNGARALRKSGDTRQVIAHKAQCKADGNKCSYHPALTRRRNDDGKEHAVERHAQCADGPQGQQVARDDAQRRARGPCRGGQRDSAVGVEGVQVAGPGDGDAEQLIGDVVADDEAVEEGG